MTIRIVDYTESMIPSVRAFNARLAKRGLRDRFYESCLPHGFAKTPGHSLYEEHFLAIEDDGEVRGAYGLKHQAFWIGGQVVSLADFWLPISEGLIDRAYAPVAALLLRDAMQRQPLIFGLGMGGYNESLPRLLAAAGWRVSSVPFFFRVLHPCSFLRNIEHLRTNLVRTAALNILAFTGIGWTLGKIAQYGCGLGVVRDPAIEVEEVAEFSSWADDLWETCKNEYGMSAVRDAATLSILYPKDNARFLRLKILRRGTCIGWALVLDNPLVGHKQFGNMRLGSLVDCMALPTDAKAVAIAARDYLERRGVDMIVSNQSHAAWQKAMKSAGFLRGPSNFLLAASRPLGLLLDQAGIVADHIHLNRGDGDGPKNL